MQFPDSTFAALRIRADDGPQPDMIVRMNLGEEAGCLENAFQRNCRPRRQ